MSQKDQFGINQKSFYPITIRLFQAVCPAGNQVGQECTPWRRCYRDTQIQYVCQTTSGNLLCQPNYQPCNYLVYPSTGCPNGFRCIDDLDDPEDAGDCRPVHYWVG